MTGVNNAAMVDAVTDGAIDLAVCESCGAVILPARHGDRPLPLDAETLKGPPTSSMVVLNAATSGALPLTVDDLPVAERWIASGRVTLHRRHDCGGRR